MEKINAFIDSKPGLFTAIAMSVLLIPLAALPQILPGGRDAAPWLIILPLLILPAIVYTRHFMKTRGEETVVRKMVKWVFLIWLVLIGLMLLQDCLPESPVVIVLGIALIEVLVAIWALTFAINTRLLEFEGGVNPIALYFMTLILPPIALLMAGKWRLSYTPDVIVHYFCSACGGTLNGDETRCPYCGVYFSNVGDSTILKK